MMNLMSETNLYPKYIKKLKLDITIAAKKKLYV